MVTEYQGQKALIKIDLNDVGGAGANWVLLGQQRDGGREMGETSEDGSVKEDGGWTRDVVTGGEWSLSGECALNPTDSGYVHLMAHINNLTMPFIQLDRSAMNGGKVEGQAVISKLSEKYTNKAICVFNVDFKMQGAMANSP